MKAMLTTVAVGGLAACAAFGGERIVFVGDSITGQSRNNAAGYAHQLDAAYAATIAEAADRPTVVSLGGSGQTVESWKNVELQSRDDATAKLDVAGLYVKENLDQPADKMVIMLGMNNILSPSTVDTPASLAAFRNNYYELVTNLVRRATPTDLYLASSPPCTEDPDGPKNLLMKKLWAILQQLAAELPTDKTCLAAQPNLRVHYLPTGEGQLEVLARGRLLSPTFHTTGDMVHPNGTGHMRLAQTFLDGFGHAAASEWLVANRLQPSLDQVAAGNQAGLSYAVAYTGRGSAPGLYAFTIKANWVTRPGESAPASAAFAIKLPEGWAEATEVVTDGLVATFAVEGPADLFENRLLVTATPASGEARTVTVTIPAPWRVSTPVAVPWSNSTGKWVFPVETAACETEAAILAKGALATVEAASATRTPAWVDLFATPDYVGGADAASLDFSAVGHAETFGTSYAARYVYAKRPVAATLSIGSSAFSATLHTTIWLNGEQVLASDAATSVSVQLRQGNNLMVVRSSHLTWQWQIAVGLAAEDNSFDLRYGLAELSESGSAPEGADYAPTKTMLGDGSELYSCVSNYTFTARCGGRLDVFLVGGGGGGGGNTEDEIVDQPGIQTGGGYECRAGGGGGGGGVVVRTGIPVKAGDVFPIAVGQGGAANQNGEPTAAFGFEALGGGHGGTKSVQATAGGSAGAPGANWATRTAFPGLTAAVPSDGVAQGHASGGGYSVDHNYFGAGGGGGGAGGPGSDGWTVTDGGDGTATTNFVRGIGGPGLACPFALADTLYGAGGNGGLSDYGQQNPAKNFGADGADGLGQGGGGCNSYVHVSAGRGGRGGSGCVIFRFYPDEIDAEAYPGKPAVSTLPDGSFIYTFAETGIFRAPSAGTISAFLVGGGGGGGGNGIAREDQVTDTNAHSNDGMGGKAGGGGGGGGVRYVESVTVEKRDYVIAVGRGGDQNRNGEPTQAFGFEVLGGGAGGFDKVAAKSGGNGGGGGSGTGNWSMYPGAEPVAASEGAPQGHAGGAGLSRQYNAWGAGGGGGGAGGPGGDSFTVAWTSETTATTNSVAGAAGAGMACPFLPNGVSYGAGGKGGYSGGQSSPLANTPADAASGTGAGGDGANSWFHINAGGGAKGGSGTVIIRFVPGDDYYASMVKHEAEGGVKRKVNGWITHEFTESGTFVVNQPMRVEVLLVGGGGAGGKAANVRGGGGGAGGVVIKTGVPLIDGEYAVSVGAGGVDYGESGGDSSFNGLVAVGGGGGGSLWNNPGKDGGSGGGGAGPYNITGETVAGGAGTEGQGCAGGCGTWDHTGTNGGAGGGGGAGGPGEDAVNGRSGKGGAAIACNFLGKGRYYAAGGGGGGGVHGGFGGEVELGGRGGYNAGAGVLVPGGDGVAGTGSGGGGEDGTANLNTGWGKGGSGVVVIRYRPVPKGLLLELR